MRDFNGRGFLHFDHQERFGSLGRLGKLLGRLCMYCIFIGKTFGGRGLPNYTSP